jgi:hypothetical protein
MVYDALREGLSNDVRFYSHHHSGNRRPAHERELRDTFGNTMNQILEIVLPAKIDNTIRGTKIPFYVFALYSIVSTVRSCIHLFSSDGGAGTIAGMDLTVAGADGIVFAFALWGSSQLLFALLQLLAVIRYRSLIPFLWLMVVLEIFLRELVGAMKPVTFAHTPPGAIGNMVMLLVATLMFALALWSALRQGQTQARS